MKNKNMPESFCRDSSCSFFRSSETIYEEMAPVNHTKGIRDIYSFLFVV